MKKRVTITLGIAMLLINVIHAQTDFFYKQLFTTTATLEAEYKAKLRNLQQEYEDRQDWDTALRDPEAFTRRQNYYENKKRKINDAYQHKLTEAYEAALQEAQQEYNTRQDWDAAWKARDYHQGQIKHYENKKRKIESEYQNRLQALYPTTMTHFDKY